MEPRGRKLESNLFDPFNSRQTLSLCHRNKQVRSSDSFSPSFELFFDSINSITRRWQQQYRRFSARSYILNEDEEDQIYRDERNHCVSSLINTISFERM